MSEMVEFRHGALCDDYETQAREQGYTLGDSAEFVEKIAFGLVAAHIHGCITDSEYDKILRRFQNMIVRNLKPMEVEHDVG